MPVTLTDLFTSKPYQKDLANTLGTARSAVSMIGPDAELGDAELKKVAEAADMVAAFGQWYGLADPFFMGLFDWYSDWEISEDGSGRERLDTLRAMLLDFIDVYGQPAGLSAEGAYGGLTADYYVRELLKALDKVEAGLLSGGVEGAWDAFDDQYFTLRRDVTPKAYMEAGVKENDQDLATMADGISGMDRGFHQGDVTDGNVQYWLETMRKLVESLAGRIGPDGGDAQAPAQEPVVEEAVAASVEDQENVDIPQPGAGWERLNRRPVGGWTHRTVRDVDADIQDFSTGETESIRIPAGSLATQSSNWGNMWLVLVEGVDHLIPLNPADVEWRQGTGRGN